jgi:general secretion pathway protein A
MVNEIKGEYDFFKITAIEQGLDVIRLDKDFSTIKKLNLPAILPFILPDGSGPSYLLIAGITADTSWIIRAGKNTAEFRVLPDDLAPFLTGTAYIPYREIPGQDGIISQLSPGIKVIKLKLLLRQLGFQDINLSPDYDENLRQVIIQIQSENEITKDGLAGPITRILLYNQIESPSTPKLRSQDDR